MSYVRTKGVVLKEVNTGEADKIVTILSRSHGKISGFAKSARRPKSRFVAGAQLFCYSEFVLFKGRDMYSLNSSDVIEPFYEIRNDVIKLTYAAHMVDILDDVVQEGQPSPRVLQLFLNALYMLAKTEKSPELITRIFEFRLLSIIGYAPFVKACISCGTQEMDSVLFSFSKCGFLCRACKINDVHAIDISVGAYKTLRHIISSNLKDLFNFEVSEQVLNELSRISKKYLKDRLEKDYKKLDFLKHFNTP
ncbi:MAG: DNA repair protein RecO [Clostridia bacterium]|nr:DNA repair protein RecO [Clostridia bacterium]